MRLGILGGGQLGKMLAAAALQLGQQVRLYDPDSQACGLQAGQACSGSFEDLAALEAFVQGLDVCTLEFENVPLVAAEWVAARVPLFPSPLALKVAQDRLLEKDFFTRLGIATPAYQAYAAGETLPRFGLLKSRRLGYDGKGQVDLSQASQPWALLGAVPALWEEKVPFERELAQIGVRSRSGQVAFYPLVETIQRDGMLHRALAPAPHCGEYLAQQARDWVEAILRELDYVGVLALELFQVGDQLLANEMAPRVHNSGHWTDRGCTTSQFENHIRAILDLPLGNCSPLGVCGLVNLIGELAPWPVQPGVFPTFYGKSPRPGRKLGHLTLLGSSLDEVQQQMREICS